MKRSTISRKEYQADIDELVGHRQWKRLLTAAFVTDVLAKESSYGNSIEKEINARTDGVYKLNPNELYPVLRFMEEKGMVTSRWDSPDRRTKRIYTLTDKGRASRKYMKEKVFEHIEAERKFLDTVRKELEKK